MCGLAGMVGWIQMGCGGLRRGVVRFGMEVIKNE